MNQVGDEPQREASQNGARRASTAPPCRTRGRGEPARSACGWGRVSLGETGRRWARSHVGPAARGTDADSTWGGNLGKFSSRNET